MAWLIELHTESHYDDPPFIHKEDVMTTLIICLFIAVLMPYLAKIPIIYAIKDARLGYDNNHPRTQQAQLQGFGARAAAAHQNSFESLIVFSTAALTALVTNNTSSKIQVLALVYIVARVIYHIAYLIDFASLRSTIWFISLVCCFAMIWICIP